MKYRLILIVFAFIATAAGCNNESAPVSNNTEPAKIADAPPPEAVVSPVDNSVLTDMPAGEWIAPSSAEGIKGTPLDSVISGDIMESQVSMNPEHGKPGHRCDIPVGALLSSPPAPPGIKYCK